MLSLLFCASLLVDMAAASLSCPGKLFDGKYYVPSTETQDLDGCSYGITGSARRNPSVGIVGDFQCRLSWFEEHLDCEGYLVNPDYVFWNETEKILIPLNPCEKNVTSCEQVYDLCSPINDGRTCGKGEYVCQSNRTQDWCLGHVVNPDSESIIKCPANATSCDDAEQIIPGASYECDSYRLKVWNQYQQCDVPIIVDMTCPPEVVSSYEELKQYSCSDHGYGRGGNRYFCGDAGGRWKCEGTISGKYSPPEEHLAPKPYHAPEEKEENSGILEEKTPYQGSSDGNTGTGHNVSTTVFMASLLGFFVAGSLVVFVFTRQQARPDGRAFVSSDDQEIELRTPARMV